MTDTEYVVKHLKGLKGAKVIDVRDAGGYPCILLLDTKGRMLAMTLSQDPEFNGPGWAEVEHVELEEGDER